MAMVRMIVNKTKIKHKDIDGNIKYFYPGEEIILSEEDAESLKKHLLDAGDQKNISKLVQDYTKGETISIIKHTQEIERVKKDRERDFIKMAEQKGKKITELESHIKSLEARIVSLNADLNAAKQAIDPNATAGYDKQLLSYEKMIESMSKEIADYQKTISKQDKEIETLKSVKSKK